MRARAERAVGKSRILLLYRLHKAGIEVILDVVYNHTAEGSDVQPYQLSFRGLDASLYYMMEPESYEVWGGKHVAGGVVLDRPEIWRRTMQPAWGIALQQRLGNQ